MQHCDICNSTPGILNYRRRDGDVVCKSCLEDHGCEFNRRVDEGQVGTVNEGGHYHPKESDDFEGYDAA